MYCRFNHLFKKKINLKNKFLKKNNKKIIKSLQFNLFTKFLFKLIKLKSPFFEAPFK